MQPKELLNELLYNSTLFDLHKRYVMKKPEQKKYDKWKLLISDLVSSCILGHRKHNTHDECFDLGTAKKRNKNDSFGQFNQLSMFDHFNERVGVFYTAAPYLSGKHNEGWKFTKQFESMASIIISNIDKKTVNVKPWSYIETGQFEYKTFIQSDGSALVPFIRDVSKTFMDRIIAWSYCSSLSVHEGDIPQYYNNGANAPWYYGKGSLNLQMVRSEIRDLIMDDYDYFDVNAAAYSIWLNEVSTPNDYQTIQRYVNDTKKFRNEIATNACMRIEDVKECINAFGNGSRITSMKNILQSKQKAFRDNETFKLLKVEVKQLQREIEIKHPILYKYWDDKRGLNKLGHKKGSYHNHASRVLYQSKLNEILQSIADLTTEPKHCLFVFDGIYIPKSESLNISDVEAAVMKSTAYKLTFSKK